MYKLKYILIPIENNICNLYVNRTTQAWKRTLPSTWKRWSVTAGCAENSPGVLGNCNGAFSAKQVPLLVPFLLLSYFRVGATGEPSKSLRVMEWHHCMSHRISQPRYNNYGRRIQEEWLSRPLAITVYIWCPLSNSLHINSVKVHRHTHHLTAKTVFKCVFCFRKVKWRFPGPCLKKTKTWIQKGTGWETSSVEEEMGGLHCKKERQSISRDAYNH